MEIKCRECGEAFNVSQNWQDKLKARGHSLPRFCAECRRLKNTVAEAVVCVECGKPAILNGLQLQKLGGQIFRCSDCRVEYHNHSHAGDPTAYHAINGGGYDA